MRITYTIAMTDATPGLNSNMALDAIEREEVVIESEIEEHGIENGLVLPQSHSKWLFRSSWLFVGSAVYGWTRPVHDLALVMSLAGITSLNYWRHPVNGPRRWVDMTVVSSGIVYHIYRACFTDIKMIFSIATGVGCSMYGLSYVYRKNLCAATGFHMATHMIANAMAVWLYTVDRVPSVLFR